MNHLRFNVVKAFEEVLDTAFPVVLAADHDSGFKQFLYFRGERLYLLDLIRADGDDILADVSETPVVAPVFL